MAVFIGIGGKARKVPNLYVGIGGKARKVKAGWIGIGGKARLFYSGDNNLVSKLTDLWTGRYYDYDTSSGNNRFGNYCEHSGNTSTNSINSYATVINKQMTVYGRKKEADEGFEGRAAIFTNQKIRLTNGQTAKVTVSVQSAGTQFAWSILSLRYGTSLPETGAKSIYANTTQMTPVSANYHYVRTNKTEYEFTFNGATGDYYVGVFLSASCIGDSNVRISEGTSIGGQVTLQGVAIK